MVPAAEMLLFRMKWSEQVEERVGVYHAVYEPIAKSGRKSKLRKEVPDKGTFGHISGQMMFFSSTTFLYGDQS